MKKLVLSVLFSTFALLGLQAQSQRLWYDKAANNWLEALPIGNSHLGAMVYGGADTEQIQLNEETFWSGSPYNNNSTEAKKHLQEVRQLIFDGREKEAHALLDKYFVKGPHGMRFLPIGNVFVKFWNQQQAKAYYRELLLDSAVVNTTYRVGQVTCRRKTIASLADNVIAMQVEADKQGSLDFSVSFDSQLAWSSRVAGHVMRVQVKGESQEGIAGGLHAESNIWVETDGGGKNENEKDLNDSPGRRDPRRRPGRMFRRKYYQDKRRSKA